MIKLSMSPAWLASLLLACVTFIYLPGLSGDFLFDDYPNIVNNPRVHATALNAQSLALAAKAYEPGMIGRPLATISFAIDYRIGGRDAQAFKISSLIVHLVNALLVYTLLLRLFALPRLTAPRLGPLAAFSVALIWAIHPLQISTVLYIVQRMEMLSLTFVLLGLLAYLRGRRLQIDGQPGWAWLIGSGLLAALGLLSKENAILFPFFTLALELTVLRFDAKQIDTQKLLKRLYGSGLAIVLAGFALFVVPHYAAPGTLDFRGFSVSERLLTQLRVLPLYLHQIVLPLPGNMPFYYDNYSVSTSLFTPVSTLAGAVLIAGLLAAAFTLRKRLPLLALGILIFFSAHLLTSNVLPLELVYEHRNYFALLGVLLAATDLIRRLPTNDGPAIIRLGVGVVIVGLAALAVLRAATWGDPVLLAKDLTERNPASPRASNDLATLYGGIANNDPTSPYFDLAIAEYKRGSLLPGSTPLPEQGLILLTALTDRQVPDEVWDRLIEKLRLLPIGPETQMAVIGLVSQRSEDIVLDDVKLATAYSILVQRQRQPSRVLAMLGEHAIKYLGNGELANRLFETAVEQSINNRTFVENLAAVLRRDGHAEQATHVVDRARQLGIAVDLP